MRFLFSICLALFSLNAIAENFNTNSCAPPDIYPSGTFVSCINSVTLIIPPPTPPEQPVIYDSYQWFKDGSPISGENIYYLSVTSPGKYKVEVIKDGCVSTSAETEVFFNKPAKPILEFVGPSSTCGNGQSTTIRITGSPVYERYEWYNGSSLLPDNNSEITISQPGLYSVVVYNGNCSNLSDQLEFQHSTPVSKPTLNTPIDISNVPQGRDPNLVICPNTDLIISTYSNPSYTYAWDINGLPLSSTTNTVTINNLTGKIRVTVIDENNCTNSSDPLAVTVSEIVSPVISTGFPENYDSFCPGMVDIKLVNDFQFFLVYNSYQWKFYGNPISGANGDNWKPQYTGDYRLTVNPYGNCSALSTEDVFVEILNEEPVTLYWLNPRVVACGNIQLQAVGNITGSNNYAWYRGTTQIGLTTDPFFTINETVQGYNTYSVQVSQDILFSEPTKCYKRSNSITINNRNQLNRDLNAFGNTICEGTGNGTITLENSEEGVIYELFKNGVQLASSNIGNGGDIDISVPMSDLVPGANSFSIRATLLGCTSTFLNAIPVVMVNAKPSAPITHNGNICGSGSTILTVTGISSDESYKWYQWDGSDYVFNGNTSDSYTTDVISIPEFYNVTIRNNSTGCESDMAGVWANINPVPTAPVLDQGEGCGREIIQVEFNNPSDNPAQVAKYNLYEYDEQSSTYNLINTSIYSHFTVSLGPPPTSKKVYGTSISNFGCESSKTEFEVVNYFKPPKPASISFERCGEGEMVFDASTTPLPDGATYKWYQGLQVPPYIGPLLQQSTDPILRLPSPGIGLFTYYLSVSTADCESSAAPVFAWIKEIPPLPVISDVYICSGTFVPLKPTGSNEYYLYDESMVKIGSIPSYGITELIFSTTKYYISGVENDCEGPKSEMTVFVGNPDPPIVTNSERCGAGPITLTAIAPPNATTYWYSSLSSNQPVHIGNQFSISSLSSSSTYWVKSIRNYSDPTYNTSQLCFSNLVAVEAIVHDIPTSDFLSSNQACQNHEIEITYTGNASTGAIYNWNFDGAQVVSGNGAGPYLVKWTTPGTKTISLEVNQNGCTSSMTSKNIQVNPLPVTDFTTSSGFHEFCINSPSVTLTGTPYGGVFSGPGVSSNLFNPQSAGAGTHPLKYVYTDVNGCTGENTISFTVYSKPAIGFSLNSQYCQNQSISLTGNPIGGTFSGNAVSGTTFNPTWSGDFSITYSYTDPGTTCSSSVTKTTTVNPKPAIYYSAGGSRCGPGQVLLIMDPISSPNVYRWFDGEGNLLKESSQNAFLTPSINAATNYSVTLFNTATGCESDPITSTAVVNQPSAPVVSGPVSAICPATSFTLTASGGVSDYVWYSIPSGGTPIGWGSTLTVSGGISSSATYYVSTIDYINSPYNCESPRTPFIVNVIPIGIPSITQTVNCGSTVLTVSGGTTGSTYNWYTDASENTPVYTSVQPTFDLALPNIYLTNRFYVQIQNVSCSSVRAAVDVQFKEQPAPPSSVQGATRCGSGEVILNAYGAPGGMRYQWYTTPTGGVPVYESLSSSFSVNVASTSTYYVGIKNTMGCVSGIRTPVTATVSSLSTPVVSDQTIIGGGAVTLTATGATGPNQSYRWYHPIDKSIGEGPSLYYYFTNTTTLYVAIVDYSYSDGCIGPKVPVNLIADGTFSINADNASICLGESATLEAPPGYSYQWTGGGIDVTSAQPIQVSPTVTTTYTAREVNSNITSQITITVMNCTLSGALLYDGADDLVEVNDEGRLNLGAGPFTMEALIRSDRLTPQGIQVILSKRNSSETDGFLFGLWSDGHLWIQLDGAPNIGYDQGPTILDGQCHHVAITRDTLFNLKFYIDGSLTYQAASGRDIGSVGGLRIGRNNFTGLYFDGLIGEVRIWDYERSQAQLQNEVNVRLNPQTGLLAYYVMEDGEGSQVLSDLSGNNNHGRLGSSTGVDNLDPIWVNGPFSCTVQGNFKTSFAESQEINNDTLSSVKSVRVYPNPFQNQTTLFIEGEPISGEVTLVITDLNGIEIFRKEEVSVNEEIPVGEDLRSGVYFVQVISEGKVEMLKLIKTE